MQPTTSQPFNGGQPLSSDQIQSMRTQFNIKPTAGNSTPGNDVSSQWAKFDQLTGKSQPSQNSTPGFTSRVSNDVQTAGKNVYNDITGGGNPIVSGFKAASDATSGVMNTASEALPSPVRGALGAVGNAAGGIVNWLGDKLGSTKLAQDFVTQHPDAAKTLENFASVGSSAGNISGGILVADIGTKGLQGIKDATVGTEPTITVGGKTLTVKDIHSQEDEFMKNLSPADQTSLANFDHEQSLHAALKTATEKGDSETASMIQQQIDHIKSNPVNVEGSTAKVTPGKNGLVKGTKESISNIKNKLTSGSEEKQLKTSIDAVNPDLSGKKLVNAYKQSVTGGRKATPPSIFREQGLSPDQQTINLGTRLQDLQLGKDPVKNLNTLKTGLSDTETKLTTALKGDPSLEFNADKPTLLTKLDMIKTQMPREFSSIKDSKSVFNNVVDFAKETVGKSEDTITGIRNARSAFDAQAKIEYPSAFKEGMIDVKTPAGRAIKTVRDSMNEHLYNTAPNGSELQKLIGREADIFRATDTIASKAAKGHAQSLPGKIIKTIKDHPVVSAASAYGVDKAVKATTGIGF